MSTSNLIERILASGTRSFSGIVSAIALVLMSTPVSATLVLPVGAQTFTTTGAGADAGLKASASFWTSGSQLMVNLANVSSADITDPGQILQAVYWDMASSVSLSLASAIADQKCTFTGGGASTCVSNAIPTVGNGNNGSQTANYKYDSNTPATPVGSRGIGSAGLGNFGGTDGMDWGILSAGDNLSTYNGGMVNGSPFAKNSVTFKMDMYKNGTNYTPSHGVGDLSINNILFNYGTSTHLLNSGLVPPTSLPEPATLCLFPLAFGFMLKSLRNRRKAD